MTFNELVNNMKTKTDADIAETFDNSFAITGTDGARYYVAKWLIEDVLFDEIDYMSQEFFEELHELLNSYETKPNYFGEGVESFFFTGEVI